MDLYAKQLELEEAGKVQTIQKYRCKVDNEDLSTLPPGVYLMKQSLTDFVEELEACLKRRGGKNFKYIKAFLNEFDLYDVAYITLKQIINAIPRREVLLTVASSIAWRLHDHMEYMHFREDKPALLRAIENNLKTATFPHKRRVILRAKRLYGIEDMPWNQEMRASIGLKLIELAIKSTGLITRQTIPKGHYKTYILQPTDEVLEFLEKAHAQCELLDPVYYPMVVEPRDWTSLYDGGFLTQRFPLVKTKNDIGRRLLERQDLTEVFNACNTLQRTGYRINQRVLEVAQQLWNSGGNIAGLPSRNLEELPDTPWTSEREYDTLKETSPELVKQWKRKATEVYDSRVRNRSKRVAVMLKLRIGDMFKDFERIYFCWSLDFRGRCYAVQSMVNPQEDDLGRSLLEFADAKDVGYLSEAYDWLCIHGANKWGLDKVSFDERVEWVKENEDMILAIADDPYHFTGWQDADEPFQYLAFCFAYRDMLHAEPIRLPITVDGSCNGLQQFSALLRDTEGGSAVNLVPHEEPADIYSIVAEHVNQLIQEDITKGDQRGIVWLGKVDRKICKRAVMTTPYGVKLYGIKQQLMDLIRKENIEIADDIYGPCAYLADKLYEAISKSVTSARACMDWLQDIARVFADNNKPIIWTTPTGFLCCQNYLRSKTKRIRTMDGGIALRLRLNTYTDQADGIRQVNGISPNFIHSIDASHLMKTVNAAKEHGITDFLMVHDSFGTHAAHMGMLSRVLREEFVKMHDVNILQKLYEELVAHNKTIGSFIPSPPEVGNLDLAKVLKSRYFFG